MFQSMFIPETLLTLMPGDSDLITLVKDSLDRFSDLPIPMINTVQLSSVSLKLNWTLWKIADKMLTLC